MIEEVASFLSVTLLVSLQVHSSVFVENPSGKAVDVPSSYIQSLELLKCLQQNVDHLRAEYESAYPRFSLVGYANNARGRVGELEATLAEQAKRIEMLQYIIAHSIPEEKTQNILEGLVEQYGSRELKERLKVQRLSELNVTEIIARILHGARAEGGAR